MVIKGLYSTKTDTQEDSSIDIKAMIKYLCEECGGMEVIPFCEKHKIVRNGLQHVVLWKICKALNLELKLSVKIPDKDS